MFDKRSRNLFAWKTCQNFIALALLLVLSMTCAPKQEEESKAEHIAEPQVRTSSSFNVLTNEEKAEGWILLFDGKTFDGWRGLGHRGIPEGHWNIQDGAIQKVPSKDIPIQEDGQPLVGGDLMTIEAFENFELSLEWKISPAGNSGIKYNVCEEMSAAHPPPYAALGFEYQILDDERHLDALMGKNRTAAALYDLIAPEGKTLKPVGEFNQARIVFHGNHGEHWLNGVKVLEYDLDTPEMDKLIEASKYRKIPDFAKKRRGHIVLQDHTDAVWFRNIKIRVLTTE